MNIKDATYLLGASLVQVGAVTQIYKIFQSQSAEDIALFWILAILVGHILRIPRSFSSEFWVWKLNHCIGIVLCAIILGQLIIYG